MCSKLIDHVTTLCGVPDDVRAILAEEVCAQRNMQEKAFRLFTEDTGSYLSIPDCSDVDEQVMRECLAKALHDNLTDIVLGMCGRGLTDKVTKELLDDGFAFGSLSTLVLGGAYRLTDEGLMEFLRRSKELQTLGLPHCSRIKGRLIHQLPVVTPKLTSLDLSYCCGIPRESLTSALASLEQLEALYLDGIVDVDDELLGSDEVLQGIKNVSVLSLNHCNITDVGLKKIGSTLKHLHTIALDHSGVSSMGIKLLVDSCPGLRDVSLKKCSRIDDEAVSHMAKHCEIQKLNLNGVGVGVTGSSIESLVQCRSKTIAELDLSWCRNIPEKAVGYLVDSCPSLIKLSLFGCNHIRKDLPAIIRNPRVTIVGL